MTVINLIEGFYVEAMRSTKLLSPFYFFISMLFFLFDQQLQNKSSPLGISIVLLVPRFRGTDI